MVFVEGQVLLSSLLQLLTYFNCQHAPWLGFDSSKQAPSKQNQAEVKRYPKPWSAPTGSYHIHSLGEDKN